MAPMPRIIFRATHLQVICCRIEWMEQILKQFAKQTSITGTSCYLYGVTRRLGIWDAAVVSVLPV